MQQTRLAILEIIKHRGQATVDDIVDELQQRSTAITPVTVRHHLKLLLEEGLITAPDMRRRATPGRPRYIYALTSKARDLFPNNYENLTLHLLDTLRHHVPADGVNVIFEGVADRMAAAFDCDPCTFEERLDRAVAYLNANGYDARWESSTDGVVPRRLERISEGAAACVYLLPVPVNTPE
jgi:predicted ArsR family transcriptional regulator